MSLQRRRPKDYLLIWSHYPINETMFESYKVNKKRNLISVRGWLHYATSINHIKLSNSHFWIRKITIHLCPRVWPLDLINHYLFDYAKAGLMQLYTHSRWLLRKINSIVSSLFFSFPILFKSKIHIIVRHLSACGIVNWLPGANTSS